MALLAGGLGLGAFARRRHREPVAELGPDPALELRAKLAESKAAAGSEAAPQDTELAETEAGDDVASPVDPQTRRRDLHERARGAIDELR